MQCTLALAGMWLFQESTGGEASLKLPDLSSVSFRGVNGPSLLLIGIGFCVFG